MSLAGQALRRLGIYDRLKSYFVEQLLCNFVAQGHIDILESRFLADLVRSLATDGPIYRNRHSLRYSTQVLAAVKAPKRKLITVDRYTWNPLGLTSGQHKEVTRRALADCVNNANVEIVEADKALFYKSYSGPTPAMTFFDANHSFEETTKDIRWAQSLGVPVIAGDDHSEDFPGVCRAVEEAGGVFSVGEQRVFAQGKLNRPTHNRIDKEGSSNAYEALFRQDMEAG